ncbi:MAG: hypothetical protein BroJett024_43080 [Alphaproteobacteria bacterium]|nr:MAG: hypothetical protein BroJett024_43080 [Alphaproteobacteria bacterium]
MLLRLKDTQCCQSLFQAVRNCPLPRGFDRIAIHDDPETIAAVFLYDAQGALLMGLQSPKEGMPEVLLRFGHDISAMALAGPRQ